MTTAVQRASRAAITRNDFQRRGATEPQRAAMRGVYGRHPDRGIFIGDTSLPEARSDDECWCERCEKTGRIMQWMGTRWMRCCGAKA